MSEHHPPDRHPTRAELGSDEAAIQYGVDLALEEERIIDDATARRISSVFHGGQASPLYALASSGAIDDATVAQELIAELYIGHDEPAFIWLDALAEYIGHHGDRDPLPAWHLLTADAEPVVCWIERPEDGDAK